MTDGSKAYRETKSVTSSGASRPGQLLRLGVHALLLTLGGQLQVLQVGQLVFMINIEKNHTVIRNMVTMGALLGQTTTLFAATATPLVNKSVVAAPNIFFQAAVVSAAHLTVGIAWKVQQPLDN